LAAVAAQDWPWHGEYLMAVIDLAVCSDESGIHDGADLCILSGYIASVKQWELFDSRWNAVLVRNDVSDFHSKDFFALDKSGKRIGRYKSLSQPDVKLSYGDWSDERANDFIDGLLSAVHDSTIHPIGSYVNTAVFFGFTYGERKYLTGGKFNGETLKWLTTGAPSKPYFLIYDHCLAEALHRTKVGMRTLFIFDQQRQFESRAVQQFSESMTVLSHRAGDVARGKYAGVLFHERTDVPGLQAADLYTHCWHRYVTDESKRGPRYEALNRLTDKVPGMKYYSQEHLTGLFRDMPPHIRNWVKNWSEADDH
jgi:hypothetical protein